MSKYPAVANHYSSWGFIVIGTEEMYSWNAFGAGGGDDWVVTGEQLKQIYDDIPADKAALRRKDTAHGQVLYSPDGYVIA